RVGEIFQIFQTEFGGTSRLIRVVAGQACNDWQLQQAVEGVEAVGQSGDVGGVTHYF
ncbi:MAG: hypothetical protein GTN78_26315, partial [Gemmatimonadales bacterium]|nr:hypothetical protein [Gemmatimonadales bacterium]